MIRHGDERSSRRQIRMSGASPEAANIKPSAEYATHRSWLRTGARRTRPSLRSTPGLEGSRVERPELQRAVEAHAGEFVADRREREGGDGLRVSGDGRELLSRGDVPELDHRIVGARRQDSAVSREGERPGFLGMSREDLALGGAPCRIRQTRIIGSRNVMNNVWPSGLKNRRSAPGKAADRPGAFEDRLKVPEGDRLVLGADRQPITLPRDREHAGRPSLGRQHPTNRGRSQGVDRERRLAFGDQQTLVRPGRNSETSADRRKRSVPRPAASRPGPRRRPSDPRSRRRVGSHPRRTRLKRAGRFRQPQHVFAAGGEVAHNDRPVDEPHRQPVRFRREPLARYAVGRRPRFPRPPPLGAPIEAGFPVRFPRRACIARASRPTVG